MATPRKVRFHDSGPVVHHYVISSEPPAEPTAEVEEEAVSIAPAPSPLPPPPPQEDHDAHPPPPPSVSDDDFALPQTIQQIRPPPDTIPEAESRVPSVMPPQATLKRPVRALAKTTCNEFELAILTKQTTNIWSHRRTAHTPQSLSTSLEVTYCPTKNIAHAFFQTQHELKTQDDVLVCSPQRTGQSAILEALYMLCNAHGDSKTDRMEDFVGWVGSALPNQLPKSQTSAGRRLFKTHMNLQPFVRSNMVKSPKVIIVLRDPVYVLDSWHRHVLDVFKMFSAEQQDGNNNGELGMTLDDFQDCMPGAYNAGLGATNDLSGESYLKFITVALDLAAKDGGKNLMIVYYEQIVSDPESLVDQLSKFVLGLPAFDDSLKREICDMWDRKRNKSNKLQVSPALRTHLGENWIKTLSASFIQGMPIVPMSYYDLFCNATGAAMFPLETFPFDKQRKRNTSSQVAAAEVAAELSRKYDDMKQLKTRAKSVITRLASSTLAVVASSTSSAPSKTEAGNREADSRRASQLSIVSTEKRPNARKSIYARLFGGASNI